MEGRVVCPSQPTEELQTFWASSFGPHKRVWTFYSLVVGEQRCRLFRIFLCEVVVTTSP